MKDRTFYIHATCAVERQRWLKQLRKAKASATDSDVRPSQAQLVGEPSNGSMPSPGPQPVSRSNLVPVQKLADGSDSGPSSRDHIVLAVNPARMLGSGHDGGYQLPVGVHAAEVRAYGQQMRSPQPRVCWVLLAYWLLIVQQSLAKVRPLHGGSRKSTKDVKSSMV